MRYNYELFVRGRDKNMVELKGRTPSNLLSAQDAAYWATRQLNELRSVDTPVASPSDLVFITGAGGVHAAFVIDLRQVPWRTARHPFGERRQRYKVTIELSDSDHERGVLSHPPHLSDSALLRALLGLSDESSIRVTREG